MTKSDYARHSDNVTRKILVIPHVFTDQILVREIEIAKRLTRWFHEVYCLKWCDSTQIDRASIWKGRASRIANALRTIAEPRRMNLAPDGVRYVSTPLLDPVLVRGVVGQERATEVARRFNSAIVRRLLGRHGVGNVLVAKPLFELDRLGPVRAFFDVVDWYPEEYVSPKKRAAVMARLRRQCQPATGVFAVSQPLAEKLRMDAGIEAIAVPNGADIGALRNVNPTHVERLRHQLGVVGKFVIGYVGNHGSFAGVDFLLDVMASLRERLINAHLLLVGPADYWRELLRRVPVGTVTATGPVPPGKVPLFVQACDIGVLAQQEDAGTRFAFQLKVVEFTACRKFVIAPPFDTWKRLSWPNVVLVERAPEAWARALVEMSHPSWRVEWDGLVEEYDWERIAGRMAGFVLGHTPRSRASSGCSSGVVGTTSRPQLAATLSSDVP